MMNNQYGNVLIQIPEPMVTDGCLQTSEQFFDLFCNNLLDVEVMTLFSVENSKSMDLVLTLYGNRRTRIVHRTECKILVRSQ